MTTTEFEHIVLLIRPQMMRLALAFFHNEEDAEDAVQDVLFKMWKRRWSPEDDIKALAITATKNQCVSMARKQQLRQHQSVDEVAEYSMDDNETDQNLITIEQNKLVEHAIGKLTRSEQRIIRMTFEQGLDAKEISIITGIHVNSVRSMISMARKKLITLLKPQSL